jgi:YidC/Oxa1 family membrane protein insertase
VVFDNRGGQISELTVSELHGKPVFNQLLIDSKLGGALSLSLNRQDLSQVMWQVDAERSSYDLKVDSLRIVFSTRLKDGREVKRVYTVYADSENISHKLIASGGFDTWALEWKAGLGESEKIVQGKGIGLTSSYYSELVYDNGTNATRQAFTGTKTFNAESGVLRWVGLRRKYVAAILNFGQQTTDRVDAEAKVPADHDKSYPHDFSLKVSNNQWEEGGLDFNMVVLPLQYDRMKIFGQNYEQILFTGWEWFLRADIWYVKLCGLVLLLLIFFNIIVPNWVLDIILL